VPGVDWRPGGFLPRWHDHFDGGKPRAEWRKNPATREEEIGWRLIAPPLASFSGVENAIALAALPIWESREAECCEQVERLEGCGRAAQRKYTAGSADFMVVPMPSVRFMPRAAATKLSDYPPRAEGPQSVALVQALAGRLASGCNRASSSDRQWTACCDS